MAVSLVTRSGVAICRTGSYLLDSGPATFTEEDLRAAVNAWQNDPSVPDRPRLRIASLEASLGLDPAEHGGEPAFGYMDNPRLSANGQEILADVHLPQWLDELLDWAYPSRSIEGAQRITAASGQRHDFVITGLALLGVHLPGISTLDDFPALMAGELGQAEDPTAVLAAAGTTGVEVRAGMDADIVRRRLVDALGTDDLSLPEGVDRRDVWPVALRFGDDGAPYAKVIDEASGRLFRVPITVSGSDVRFGALAEVVEQDVPVAASAGVRPSVMWATRADDRPNTNTEDDEMNDEQRRTLARRFGLPEDATEAQIMEAAQNTPPPPNAETPPSEPSPSPQPQPAPSPPPPSGTESDPSQADSENQPVAASDGTVRVSAQQWQETQDRLAQLAESDRQRAERETRERRDGIVAAAVREGRITPAERDTWRARLDQAEEPIAETLASLAPSRAVPVAERGATPQDPGDGSGEREISDEEHERTMASMGLSGFVGRRRRPGIHHDRQEA